MNQIEFENRIKALVGEAVQKKAHELIKQRLEHLLVPVIPVIRRAPRGSRTLAMRRYLANTPGSTITEAAFAMNTKIHNVQNLVWDMQRRGEIIINGPRGKRRLFLPTVNK